TDLLFLVAWGATLLVVVVVALMIRNELVQTRRLREQDFRWRRSRMAKDVLSALWSDRLCRDAIAMLEWPTGKFEVTFGNKQEVCTEDLGPALSNSDNQRLSPLTDKQLYIRECFSGLADALELLEHDLRTGLLDFVDVEFPMAHTVAQLRSHWPLL